MKNGLGRLLCISYKSPIKNPYKQNKEIYPLNVCILQAEERLCCPCDTEIGGIQLALKYIIEHEELCKNRTIFIGTDSQSILLKLK